MTARWTEACMGWGHTVRLRHMTSGKYLASTEDNQVTFFPIFFIFLFSSSFFFFNFLFSSSSSPSFPPFSFLFFFLLSFPDHHSAQRRGHGGLHSLHCETVQGGCPRHTSNDGQTTKDLHDEIYSYTFLVLFITVLNH